MKFKLRYKRRYNMFITLLACASALWLMVMRFGVSVESLLSIAVYCFVALVFIALVAALVALLGRWLVERREK